MNNEGAGATAQPAGAGDDDMANPLLSYLGISLREWAPGHAVFEMPVEPRHLNRQGTLQGGVIATMLDAACGYAGMQTGEQPQTDGAVTLMLTISYHAKVRSGTVRAVGSVTKAGRSIFFSRAELLDEHGELIATSQGTFKRSKGPSAG